MTATAGKVLVSQGTETMEAVATSGKRTRPPASMNITGSAAIDRQRPKGTGEEAPKPAKVYGKSHPTSVYMISEAGPILNDRHFSKSGGG
jgi:hypothetical protein